MSEVADSSADQTGEPASELLYFADPMCSWCWGFAPVIEKVAANYANSLPLHIFVGGLAVGVKKPLGEKGKAEIQAHWRHVEQDTGQSFDYAFFDRESFVYNSELPSYAVVAVRNARLNALYFLTAIQRAFYQRNRDITSLSTLSEIAGEIGLDESSFRAKVNDRETIEHATKDFELSQRLGIQGFPALLGMANKKIELLTMGYQPYDALVPKIDEWCKAI